MSESSAVAGYRGNYFSESEYIDADVKKGVLRNRAGTRMIVLTNDFLLGLMNALVNECGPAADLVLKACGKNWGKQFAKRFEAEIGDFYEWPLQEAPVSLFAGCIVAAFSHHGWGKLSLDFGLHSKGLILADVVNPIYASLIGSSERPVESLTAGVLAGMFSHLAKLDLDCIQTACASAGHASSKFAIGLPERLEPFAEAAAEGKSHAEILAELETSRV